MKISASILIYDSPMAQIRKAVDSLLSEGIENIILLYNGNQRGYLRREDFPEARIFEIDNHGYGAGHNVAIRMAADEGMNYHLVMNADVRWSAPVVIPMVRYLDTHPDAVLLSPKTFYPDGTFQHTARMLPTPFDMLLRLIPGSCLTHRRRRYLLADRDIDRELNVPYLLGNFLLFRMDAIKDVGMFDERFFMYPEDIDITRRLHRIGETLYWPEVSVIHDHARASRRNFRLFAIHLRNMIRYFNKWGWFFDIERRRFNRSVLTSPVVTSGKHR